MKNNLSGIERELVIQYLIDGNVPVTLTPVGQDESERDDVIHSLPSQIFPIAIKGENLKVAKSGKILLENPPQSVISFEGKKVKVEFYFNRVGLFFISELSHTSKGFFIAVPKEIERIVDIEDHVDYDFSAVIYFDCKTQRDLNTLCIPHKEIELFTRPAWKIIKLEKQQLAKELLEEFVEAAKTEKNVGNGIQLIPICKYLSESEVVTILAMEGRQLPLNILYVDHDRLVLGLETKNCTYFLNDEYGIKMSFSIKNSPILSRDIFVMGTVNKIYRSFDGNFSAVDFKYTNIQEEDLRFLYEKATSTLFI
mgnify:CR=1 FL=1